MIIIKKRSAQVNSIFTFDFDNEDKIAIEIDDTLEKYDQYGWCQ